MALVASTFLPTSYEMEIHPHSTHSLTSICVCVCVLIIETSLHFNLFDLNSGNLEIDLRKLNEKSARLIKYSFSVLREYPLGLLNAIKEGESINSVTSTALEKKA